MRRFLYLLVLVCLLSSGCNIFAVQKQEYIGLKYIKCPNGVIDYGGWVIGGTYIIKHVRKGKIEMLWLNEAVYSNDKVKHYVVLNILELPKIDDNYILIGRGCKINNQDDPSIIAIAKNGENQEFLTDVKYAWRVEINKKFTKFVKIDTKVIVCTNESYGI